MKILYTLGTFPIVSSEAYLLNEIVELTKLGHDIRIFAHSMGRGKVHGNIARYNLLQNTIYNKTYGRGAEKALDFSGKAFFDLIKNPLDTARSILSALKIHKNIWHLFDSYLGADQVRNLEFDLICVSFPHLNYLSQAFYLSRTFKKPFVVTFRALDIYKKEREEDLRNRAKLINKASGIITISSYNRPNIIKKFGIKDRIELIHDSVDPGVFRPAASRKRRKLISICRFVEKKGIDHLIRACRILKNKGVEFECLLIGDGPLKDDYGRLIKKYGLGKHIRIKGFLTQEEIRDELSESMVFVLPCVIAENGDRDILPNVLKEAMAMELPVVTSGICGIEELVENGKDGMLVPPGDPKAIAGALEKLFSDETFREKMGKAGREKIKREFNIQVEAKKLEALFEGVIAGHKT